MFGTDVPCGTYIPALVEPSIGKFTSFLRPQGLPPAKISGGRVKFVQADLRRGILDLRADFSKLDGTTTVFELLQTELGEKYQVLVNVENSNRFTMRDGEPFNGWPESSTVTIK